MTDATAEYQQQALSGIPDGQEWRATARVALLDQWLGARRSLARAEGEVNNAKAGKKSAEAGLERVEASLEHVQTCRLAGCVVCEELGRNAGGLPSDQEQPRRAWEADPLAEFAPACPTCEEPGEHFVPCGLFHGEETERCPVLARTVCVNGHEFSSLHGRLRALASLEEFNSTRWEPFDGVREAEACVEGHPATAARFEVGEDGGRAALHVSFRCAEGHLWEPELDDEADQGTSDPIESDEAVDDSETEDGVLTEEDQRELEAVR